MGKVLMTGGGGGGVGSDELTVTSNQVLEGNSYVGRDTNDELGVGTMKNLSTRTTITHASDNATPVILGDEAFMSTNSDGVSRVEIRYQGDNGYINSNTSFGIAPSKMAAVGGLTAAKMIGGQYAFGITGTALNDSTLTSAGNLLLNQIAYGKNGVKYIGTMPNNGTQNKTITPSASAQSYTIPAGYHNGSGKVSVPAVSNLKAEYIKKGVTVGGVTGTWSGYVPTATDLYLRGNNIKGWTNVNGCVFQSGCIEASTCGYNGGFKTESHIDLSPYSKLNVEYLMTFTNFYHNNAMIQLNTTANFYYTDKYMSIPNDQLNTTLTVSFDISTINMTAGKIRITFIGGDTADKAKTNNSGPLIQVYRVWLS